MKRAIPALLVGLLALAGCGNDLQGRVTEKQYKRGYTWLMPVSHQSCSGTGTSRVCTSYTTHTPMWVPDCHEVTVKGAESGSTCLAQSEWDKIEVGDDYTGPDVDPKDRAEEKG